MILKYICFFKLLLMDDKMCFEAIKDVEIQLPKRYKVRAYFLYLFMDTLKYTLRWLGVGLCSFFLIYGSLKAHDVPLLDGVATLKVEDKDVVNAPHWKRDFMELYVKAKELNSHVLFAAKLKTQMRTASRYALAHPEAIEVLKTTLNTNTSTGTYTDNQHMFADICVYTDFYLVIQGYEKEAEAWTLVPQVSYVPSGDKALPLCLKQWVSQSPEKSTTSQRLTDKPFDWKKLNEKKETFKGTSILYWGEYKKGQLSLVEHLALTYHVILNEEETQQLKDAITAGTTTAKQIIRTYLPKDAQQLGLTTPRTARKDSPADLPPTPTSNTPKASLPPAPSTQPTLPTPKPFETLPAVPQLPALPVSSAPEPAPASPKKGSTTLVTAAPPQKTQTTQTPPSASLETPPRTSPKAPQPNPISPKPVTPKATPPASSPKAAQPAAVSPPPANPAPAPKAPAKAATPIQVKPAPAPIVPVPPPAPAPATLKATHISLGAGAPTPPAPVTPAPAPVPTPSPAPAPPTGVGAPIGFTGYSAPLVATPLPKATIAKSKTTGAAPQVKAAPQPDLGKKSKRIQKRNNKKIAKKERRMRKRIEKAKHKEAVRKQKNRKYAQRTHKKKIKKNAKRIRKGKPPEKHIEASELPVQNAIQKRKAQEKRLHAAQELMDQAQRESKDGQPMDSISKLERYIDGQQRALAR